MPQPNLTTLPTEIVEKIAEFLDPDEILNFRRAHPRLAEKSFDAFAASFLSNMIWDFRGAEYWHDPNGAANKVARIAAGLEQRCAFAKNVNCLALRNLAYHRTPSKVVAHIQLLQNVRTLDIHNIMTVYTQRYTGDLFGPAIALINLPRLEALTLRDTPRLKPTHLATLIRDHRKTLKKLEFHNIMMWDLERRMDEKPGWISLLEAAATIQTEGIVKLFRPQVSAVKGQYVGVPAALRRNVIGLVSLSPPAHDPDPNSFDHSVLEEVYCTKPGHLSRAVDCFVRNYQEIRSREEWCRWREGASSTSISRDEMKEFNKLWAGGMRAWGHFEEDS